MPALLAATLTALAAEAPVSVSTLVRPDTTPANDFYVGNRAPLLPAPLIKLPVGAVRPRSRTDNCTTVSSSRRASFTVTCFRACATTY